MDPGKQPAMQVVGFRVEGVQPSPEANNFLMNDHRPVDTGSPTPVIIPPTFQPTARDPNAQPPLRPTASIDAAGVKALLDAPLVTSTGTALAPMTAALPLSPAMTLMERTGSASLPVPTVPMGPSATPALSQPKAILHTERSEAGHVGLQRPPSPSAASDTASVVSGVSTAIFRTDESQYQRSTSSPGPPVASSPARGRAHTQPKASTRPSAPAPPSTTPAGQAPAGGADKPLKSQKEMTKAERRELQEQQRAAKAQAQGGAKAPGKKEASGGGGPPGPQAGVPKEGRPLDGRPSIKGPAAAARDDRRADQTGASSQGTGTDHSVAGGVAKAKKQQGAKVVSLNPTEMFAHLQQFKRVSMETLLGYKDAAHLPPEVLQLGLRYADGSVTGASARCMAMLHVFCQVIAGYSTPANARLNRDLTSQLNTIIDFLVRCRPLALSMGNAIKWLKLRIAAVPPEMPEAEAKAQLVAEIKDYVRNRIDHAHMWLAQLAAEKVDEGDVILTYAYSHIVSQVLLEALSPSGQQQQQGGASDRPPKRFRVVVVDSRPEHEGLLMLKKLQAAGIACTYAHMNALSFVMQGVTKVFLGASAVMSNGTVMSRAGSAAVAMMAHAHSKPVIVCCESYKFHERVQLDAITHNELGDPDALSRVEGRPDVHALGDWQSTPRLALLNLKYDAMPAHYVTAIVTEHALIPPTSVPVVIREYMAMNRE